jgi:hypothetical protein
MSLTQEQRDALRKVIDAAGPDMNVTPAIVDAACAVRTAFADALRPPKMATREYEGRKGEFWRIAREDGKDVVEFRWGVGAWVDLGGCPENEGAAAILAAARDTEFHEVDD